MKIIAKHKMKKSDDDFDEIAKKRKAMQIEVKNLERQLELAKFKLRNFDKIFNRLQDKAAASWEENQRRTNI